MANIFNTTEFDKIPSNDFDLSHTNLTTCKFGELIPTSVTECMPGDKFTFNSSRMTRLMPMIAPIMGNVRVIEEWFFVPNRILWKKWEEFISNETDYEFPTKQTWDGAHLPVVPHKSLLNYMGIGFGTELDPTAISAIPLAGYIKIWNEYYREQSITDSIPCDLEEGNNDMDALGYEYWYPPLTRAWRKDYFTAALPAAQKGNPILLPLTRTNEIDVYLNSKQASWDLLKFDGSAVTGNKPLKSSTPGGASFGFVEDGSSHRLKFDPDGTLSVNVNDHAATVETLRAALALQSFFEKDARGGTRYVS